MLTLFARRKVYLGLNNQKLEAVDLTTGEITTLVENCCKGFKGLHVHEG